MYKLRLPCRDHGHAHISTSTWEICPIHCYPFQTQAGTRHSYVDARCPGLVLTGVSTAGPAEAFPLDNPAIPSKPRRALGTAVWTDVVPDWF